jgi:hypothetical protein
MPMVSAAGGAPQPSRCAAAHAEDASRCDGPVDAVRVTDRTGDSATGCVRHSAVLLASLTDGQVAPGPGARPGDVIEAYTTARHLPPFAFERAVDRGTAGVLPPEAVPAVARLAEYPSGRSEDSDEF